MISHTLALPGCTPEPLMNYLKALGVLRLVGEQADPNVRAKWVDGVFTLDSTLSTDTLVEFFSEKYRPTPVLSPWNGDGGFLTEGGASFETIQAIERSTDRRLQPLQQVITRVRGIDSLREFGVARQRVKVLDKKKKARVIVPEEMEELSREKSRVKSLKEGIVFQIRSQFPDECLNWIDACMLVEPDGFSASPLLGSGGVDGRLEFSANFLANVLMVVQSPLSKGWLQAALFEIGDARLLDTAIGQFAPGRIGGPNATQGMEGSSIVNPWDFVLMIEGSFLLAGAVSRKLNIIGGSRAAFPFTVRRVAAAGEQSLSGADSNVARGEIWLPLWHRASSLAELRTLFSEGRAEVSGRQSRDGIEFARAVASLGVGRGIESFSRQGFLRRNGLAFLATPLGRFSVRRRGNVDLIRQIDSWLGTLRMACGETAPARFSANLRRIERAIFDYCRYGGARFFQGILLAIGAAGKEVSRTSSFREKAKGMRPLANLSAEWVAAANDGSREFELALALAGIRGVIGGVGPLRVNLEPVALDGSRAAWAEKDRAVVWNASDLSSNLAAVMSRRVMDGLRSGSDSRFLSSKHCVSMETIAAFLAGGLDENRISELVWGLVLCNTEEAAPSQSIESGEIEISPLPRAFALLKLLFLDLPEKRAPGSPLSPEIFEKLCHLRPDPGILTLVRAGNVPAACCIAARRLRATGFQPRPHVRSGGHSRDREWIDTACDSSTSTRLAAALLFPIDRRSIVPLCEMVCRPLRTSNL